MTVSEGMRAVATDKRKECNEAERRMRCHSDAVLALIMSSLWPV